MKSLRELLGFCKHEWSILRETDVSRPGETVSCGTHYVLRCSKCGKIKGKTCNL